MKRRSSVKSYQEYNGQDMTVNHLPNILKLNEGYFDNHIQFHIENKQYSSAGYYLMFGHMSKSYSQKLLSPFVDARLRRKLLNKTRSLEIEKEIESTYGSGPTNFFNNELYNAPETSDYLVKADIVSAYPNYLLTVKRPGVDKTTYEGFYPAKKDTIMGYKCRFSTIKGSDFANWFIAEEARIAKISKLKTIGDMMTGEILIYSSNDMRLLEYAMKMDVELEVVLSYIYSGEPVRIDMKNLKSLLIEKTIHKNPIAKQLLNTSTGHLANIDRSSYWHMVQHTKFILLDFVYKNNLQNDIISVVTDSLLIRITDENYDKMVTGYDSVIKQLEQYEPLNEVYYDMNTPMGCGRFTVELVTKDELDITNKRFKLKEA